jgi:hypothetical protein
MADRILAQRWGDSLRPVSKAAKEVLAKIPDRELVIIEVRTKRSDAQNALYWAVLGKVADNMGHIWPGIDTKDQLHVALKLALGKYDLMEVKGKAVPVPHSTSRMSVKEFTEYFNAVMDRICRDILPKIGDADLTAEIVGMLAPKEEAAA